MKKIFFLLGILICSNVFATLNSQVKVSLENLELSSDGIYAYVDGDWQEVVSLVKNLHGQYEAQLNEERNSMIFNAILEIRQIGDKLLHEPTPQANFYELEEIRNYEAILKETQEKYGGVGLATNQCRCIKKPISMFLIGTDDENTREVVQKRYPNETLPSLTLMINPVILDYSEETYYPQYGEGCLSVSGPLRGKVKRHKTVRVRYQDINGSIIEKECFGFEAHIFQHEYDHLKGIVFLQKIFMDCTAEQKNIIESLIQKEINNRQNKCSSEEHVNAASNPSIVFDRDGDEVVFETKVLSFALTQLPDEILNGIKTTLHLNATYFPL